MLGELTGWWVDYWTFAHFIEWAIGAMAVCWFVKLKLLKVAMIAFAIGVLWECVELWIFEPALGFSEPWWNRWVSDIVVDVSGSVLGALLISKIKRVLLK